MEKVSPQRYRSGDTLGLKSEAKPRAKEALAKGIHALAELQDVVYAGSRWGVLIIFQAMDAADKDGAIKHVMSGVNPQGCEVFSFKSPSAEELDHDYLWRSLKCLPERGHIGIFNRSYYEETLVVRVHPEFLERQKLPPEFITKDIWKNRFQDIRNFERHPQWHRDSKDFFPCLEEGAEEAPPGRAGEPGEELEVLGERYQGA